MADGNYFTTIGDASTVQRCGIDVNANVIVPANARAVLVQGTGVNVRWTHDGTTPDANTGMLLIAGDSPIRIDGKGAIRNLRFYEATAAAKILLAFVDV